MKDIFETGFTAVLRILLIFNLIVKQRSAKTGTQRKPPDLPNAELGFLTCSLPRLKQKRRETSCLRVGGLEGPLRRKVNKPTNQIDFSRTIDKRTQQTIHPIKTQLEYLGGGGER